MVNEKIRLDDKEAEGYVIPLGTLNMVAVVTDIGMVGCGVFDVYALDHFHYPAAGVRSSTGAAIATVDDLLKGIVKDANHTAQKRGINIGMSGKHALDLL